MTFLSGMVTAGGLGIPAGLEGRALVAVWWQSSKSIHCRKSSVKNLN